MLIHSVAQKTSISKNHHISNYFNTNWWQALQEDNLSVWKHTTKESVTCVSGSPKKVILGEDCTNGYSPMREGEEGDVVGQGGAY